MARTLILMRHAQSSWEHDPPDHLRDLSDRGRRDAHVAGEILVQRGLEPYVLLSPTRRTHATWEEMAAAGVQQQGQRELGVLYDHDLDLIVEELRKLPAEVQTVLCVGHAPTTPSLVEVLCERQDTKPWSAIDEKFPTAAMAVLEVDGDWIDLGERPAHLTDYVVPRA